MYRLREWQKKYKKTVVDKLREGKIVALQAPTGSGKTLFSLLVGKELGKKVIFLTNFYNEFSRVMEDAMKIGLRPIYLVSKVKSCMLYDVDEVDSEDIECVFEPNSCKKFCTEVVNAVKNNELSEKVFNECKSRCDEGQKTPCLFRTRAENILLPKGLPIFPDEFIADMKRNAICAYWYTLKELNNYNVIIMHYYYFFHKHIHAIISRYINFGDYLIVVDEAHNLDKINEIYKRTIDINTVLRALSEVDTYLNDSRIKEKIKKDLLNISDSLKTLVNNFKTDKMVYVSKFGNFYMDDENLNILEKTCVIISHKVLFNSRLNICRVFKFYRAIHDNGWPVFLEPDGSFTTLPLTPSIVLSETFNDDYDIMIMSGTLPSKEYIRKIWGIERSIEYINVDYKQGHIEYKKIFDVTTRYTDRNEDMFKKYAEYITSIYNDAKGVVLTVYPSYDVMENIVRYLNIDNKYVENRNSNLSEVKKLALQKRKLLVNAIAGSKLTEGVELTDGSKSLISDIIIAGIPYPKVDDYLKLRNEEISRTLKEDIDNLVMNEIASIRIRQAIGRGIRNENDKITVWLLDSRFQFFHFLSDQVY